MMEIIRSEWTKIRSVRSTVWTLAATALLMLGIGVLLCVAVVNSSSPPPDAAAGVRLPLAGVMFAPVAIATFGVLVISSEYRTGAIRVSLMAVPQRLKLLAGKVVVFTAVSLVVSMATAFVTFWVGQAILGAATLSDPGALRTVVGVGLYLTASGLFGLALGALVRHTPGAVVAAMMLMLVLPQVTTMLPGTWGATVHKYFTTNAGIQVATPTGGDALGPWAGYGVYLGWIAVTMIAAAVLLKRRDA
ncbi:ABC transporter permease subunit [Nonomuraea sp. NPDC005983]|uniref:ABC transporter permease subunit n=1 Tax=Nonomuraea sp. NPDC005983 TaxID=3155595 RepID=UPI00339EA07B